MEKGEGEKLFLDFVEFMRNEVRSVGTGEGLKEMLVHNGNGLSWPATVVLISFY